MKPSSAFKETKEMAISRAQMLKEAFAPGLKRPVSVLEYERL